MRKSKGQIWSVARKMPSNSSTYGKTRPWCICNSPEPNSSWVHAAPMSTYRGKIEDFQMYYEHHHPSIIHIENKILVPAESFISYQGTISSEAIKRLDTKIINYYDLNHVSFINMEDVLVVEFFHDSVKVMITYNTGVANILSVNKKDLCEKLGVPEGTYFDRSYLKEFFSGFRGLQFLHEHGEKVRVLMRQSRRHKRLVGKYKQEEAYEGQGH